jgi:hypothetical protein
MGKKGGLQQSFTDLEIRVQQQMAAFSQGQNAVLKTCALQKDWLWVAPKLHN